MSTAPELLLANHLKTLRLPTFLREHDKLARICAAEGMDHVRQVPSRQKPGQLRLQSDPVVKQNDGLGSGTV